MKIKQICSKLLSLKKSDYIVFALMGILILIVAIPTGGADKKEKNDSEIAYEDQSRSENENYGKELEKQLKDILEKIDGVGKAEVMITLKSSKESVLNKDLSEEKQTEEERSGETQKVNKNQKKQEETILSDSSGNSAPYVIKELEPEISGIVISCEGAGNKVVEASVLEAVQVLFGVSANHIKVLKMEVAK